MRECMLTNDWLCSFRAVEEAPQGCVCHCRLHGVLCSDLGVTPVSRRLSLGLREISAGCLVLDVTDEWTWLGLTVR